MMAIFMAYCKNKKLKIDNSDNKKLHKYAMASKFELENHIKNDCDLTLKFVFDFQ